MVSRSLSRRDIISSAGMVAVTAGFGKAFAGEPHHQHGSANVELKTAASDCINSGQTCLDHCLAVIETGDTGLARCASSVAELIAVCGAERQLAATNSTRLAAMTEVCRASCRACEEECRKHEDEHDECRACAKSCARMIAASDSYLAAA